VTTKTAGHDPLVGKTFGHYRIIEQIGSGGMGVVYRAHDEHLDREIAIKVLPLGTLADDSSRHRFRNEALVLSKLNHPNIATIHDFDTQQGLDFLVMEYIPGVTLSEKLAQTSLPEKQVIALGAQLAEGLSAAHEHSVIHRDLKPGNLRLTRDGRLKILDFGLAKLRASVAASPASETLSTTHAFVGTLPYMAPEQILGGEIDARTDIHAAGAVLYEMATGQRAFPMLDRSQLTSAILGSFPKPADSLSPGLSAELSRIIGKCLEKEPENRYQSANELNIDLRRLQSSGLVELQRLGMGLPHSMTRGVKLSLLVLTSALAILLAFNISNLTKRLSGRGATPRIESLAVLPLANLSGDAQQEYFADGMTEALIAELAQISSLRVISRTSTMRYKGSNKALPEIAHELNVNGIIEGSVLRSGDRVRITAQLIDAASDTHLWAKSYERDLREVLTLQHEVAQAITDEIKAQVSLSERTRLGTALLVNPEAYELYLKGRYYRDKRTSTSLAAAKEYFQKAIDIDPSYALAHAGLADTYAFLGGIYGVAPPAEAFPNARKEALKAIDLDRTLAEPHTSLGMVKFWFDWDFAGAEREFQRSIDLNPHYASAHQWYAWELAATGHFDKASAETNRALENDPFSVPVNTSGIFLYRMERKLDQALDQCKRTLELDPKFARAHANCGLVYQQEGLYEDAIGELKQAVDISGGSSVYVGLLGSALGQAGKKADALRIFEELKRRSKREYIPPYDVAIIYMGLGQKAEFFSWTMKACEDRSSYLVWLKVDPVFDPLRSDPRFNDLLERIGLPQ